MADNLSMFISADDDTVLEMRFGQYITTAAPQVAAYADQAAQSVIDAQAVLSTSLLKANNLSDVASATTARTNLGLGTAAVQNVGAFAQTANNLSDVANASTALANLGGLAKASNLSDVANVVTARSNLSAAKSGANSDITSLSGLTTALSISQGGTGAATQAAALTALLGSSAVPVANGGTGATTVAGAVAALGLSTISGRNKLINGNFAINQRAYTTGTATTGANQYTLDRWRVVTSGQSLAFAASGNGNQVTAPAGGVEQVVEGNNIEGGTYTLSWTGTATATVNGTAVANGATIALTAATNATVRFTGGTVSKAQLELGTVATPFDMRLYPVELALCQRYYQTVFFDYTAYGTTGSNMTCGTVLPVPLRATGTATYVSSANLTNAGTPSVFANGSNRFTMGVTVTATGMMQALGVQWTLNAEL